jgi:hypothetical protein
MAATSSIRVIKTFTYRGQPRTFSNRYHMGTAVPPDSSHWTTFSDAVVAAEKTIFESVVLGGARIIGTVGYAPGSEVPVFNKTYSVEGTLSYTSLPPLPGDVAALIRWSTPDRSTKNHPIYLFNYYHGVKNQGGFTDSDLLNSSQKTAMATYGAAWVTGFSDGTTTFKRSRPSGDLATGVFVQDHVTHRDLPR